MAVIFLMEIAFPEKSDFRSTLFYLPYRCKQDYFAISWLEPDIMCKDFPRAGTLLNQNGFQVQFMDTAVNHFSKQVKNNSWNNSSYTILIIEGIFILENT